MQFMETINMGNLINSRLAFIELIKILYQMRVCHKSVTHPFLFFAFSQIRNL